MIKVLVLNASLKHKDNPTHSNTEELSQLVLDNMGKYGEIDGEIVRLADYQIDIGLSFKESDADQWPEIVEKIKAADVVIFGTPIWWGQRSSLIQRVIERMDAFDEEYIAGGRSALLGKVAGVVITGSEDGAQQTLGSILEVLTFLNFTIPPQGCAYWVGEVGGDPKEDREKRLKSKAAQHMAENLAKSLVEFAKLLKANPLTK
jgi:multimeric flavodoxin WrbA